MNSEVKYETSGETSEKVVKRLNGKNYLFVPKILTEQHEEASGSGITESGLDSNEEFESDFQTNGIIVFLVSVLLLLRRSN